VARTLPELLELLPDAAVLVDAEGRITLVNRQAEGMFGYPRGALVGRPVEILLPERFERAHRAHRAGYRAAPHARPMGAGLDLYGRREDGSEFPVDITLGPLETPDGPAVLGVIRDMTERRAADELRRELLAREQAAREAAEAARERIAFLADLSRTLAGSLDSDTTLRAIADQVVPRIADWCVVDVLAEDGAIRRVAAVHADGAKAPAMARLVADYPPAPDSPQAAAHVLRTGEPLLEADVTEAWLASVTRDEAHRRLVREMGIRSLIAVPLEARGRILGAITLASGTAARRYTQDDLKLATAMAQRAALAVDNARLYGEAQSAIAARQEMLNVSNRRGAQLEALHSAGLNLVSNLSLEAVLGQAVDMARELVGARYGALSVLADDGSLARFITSGVTDEERARLGDLPKGRGLLGVVLFERGPVRVDDIAADPRRSGFPQGHPPMTSFLGVPIATRGRTLGNLYLTDKVGPAGIEPFDAEDEAFLELIASQVAVAAENARLHSAAEALATVAERERIARELHDSLAQILGLVRLQAGTARARLAGEDAAGVAACLEAIDSAAADAYADVREAILGFRSRVTEQRDLVGALGLYLERYELQSGLRARLEMGEGVQAARVMPAAEAQLLRIIQEALANVRKHAESRSATVRLELAGDGAAARMRVSVRDDGRGFDAGHRPSGLHFGLESMRERAAAVGGTLAIESAPGRGTCVVVELPLDSGPSGPRG